MSNLIKLSLVLGLAIPAGCSREQYNVTTEIKSDGSIARRVIQPTGDRLPDASRKNWDQTRIAFDYESAISGVEKPRAENDAPPTNKFFVAEGTFKSVGAIPDHYEQKSVDGSRSGRLKRDYTKNDYGFFVEHNWSEELTDPVHPEEFPEAVQKLTRFLADVNELGLHEYLGRDIDIQPMTEWIENDGAEIILECLLVGLQMAGRKDPELFAGQEGRLRLKQIAERHGIPIEGDKFDESIDRFLRAELPKRIRYKDGRPIEDDRMEIVRQYYSMDNGEDEQENACRVAFDRAIEKKYGDDFEKQHALLTPLLGVYGDQIFGTPQFFKFSLKLPGLVVETNGVLVSDSQVKWKFDQSDATFCGYQMSCRSIERIDKVCDRILKADALRTRDQLLQLLALAQDEEVKKTLLEVAKNGSGLFDLPNEVRELLPRKK